MTRLILPVLLVLTTLACSVSSVAQLPPAAPGPTATTRAQVEPSPVPDYDVLIVTSTALNIRTGAGVENSIVTVVPAGTKLYGEQCRADGWCWSSEQAGWFCAGAAIGGEGCER